MQYLIFFHIGYVIRKFRFETKMQVPLLIITHVSLFLLAVGLEDCSGLALKLLKLCVDLLLHTVSAVMVFTVLQTILNNRAKEMLNRLSTHSMNVYLIHQQLVYFINRWLIEILSPVPLVIVSFLLTMITSVFISAVLQRVPICAFLLGNRKLNR